MPPALAVEESMETEESNSHRAHWISRFKLLVYVLKQGIPTELEATAVALEERILIVEIDGDFVSINMPGRWIYDGETTGLPGLFDGEPFQLNDLLTINTLKIQMEQETHTVTAYFAYKIEGEVAAEAILPFNIES
jgi:hypothetical protein